MFGSGDYAMRIWLNPDEVAERNMTAAEVLNAVRGQNIQVAAGQIGGYVSVWDLETGECRTTLKGHRYLFSV